MNTGTGSFKNVLITGKGSDIGENIKKWLDNRPGFHVEELDLRDDRWIEKDFSRFDSVVHVAAIVHIKKNLPLETYRKVNTELPILVANRAKASGVGQFIFFSTMGVYGKNKMLPSGNVIDGKTPCNPNTNYSISKLEAEDHLRLLDEGSFPVAIIRPPNIFGPLCRGNYIKTFLKITKMSCLFPEAYPDSRQGLLYIDNLCELVRFIIENHAGGLFTPQDVFMPNTVDMIRSMAEAMDKKVLFFSLPKTLEHFFGFCPLTTKLFGGVSYCPSIIKTAQGDYNLVSFPESINRTVLAETKNGVNL
jgi:UDP-glucose 4-epimerase